MLPCHFNINKNSNILVNLIAKTLTALSDYSKLYYLNSSNVFTTTNLINLLAKRTHFAKNASRSNNHEKLRDGNHCDMSAPSCPLNVQVVTCLYVDHHSQWNKAIRFGTH